MIHIVILEDELPSRTKIKRYLAQQELPFTIVAELDSVESAINFFEAEPEPRVDLLFSDIELLDGNVFQLFEQVSVPCPIIFSTAYNQFWMEAFETNGIEYLLKPYGPERFEKAWNKFLRLRGNSQTDQDLLVQLQQVLQLGANTQSTVKSRLKIPTSRGSYFLVIEKVVGFQADAGVVWAVDNEGKRHLLQEPTLKEIEAFLDPSLFFRINRSQLVQKQFVMGIERYSKNSVTLKIHGVAEQWVCSQSATPGFLAWMER